MDDWLHINLYSYEVLPKATVSQYDHITLMAYLLLMGVRTQDSMVEGKDDEAVTSVNSEKRMGSFRNDKSVDCQIYISDSDKEKGYR
jgi:hypothetical protein